MNQKYTNTIPNEYYFNLYTQTFICLETAFENKKFQPYIYKHNIAGKMKWQLENDFKMISGYRCQKATIRFRGRNYIAWFAPKIPLPYGPWKLNGLPGLILEAYDDTKEVYFSANQITIPFDDTQEKLKKPTAVKEIAFKAFIEKRKQESENVIKSIQARLPKGSKTVSTNVERKGLELTYEWEKK
ncbi:GLPGLI family protein [Mesonia ostreae]|uniref:GLPGLI family protein n=1 Tax=Mesonia ostreae TaxID=861110 RepID=UPI0035CF5AEB